MQTNNKLREALEATNKFLESAITDGKITAQDITALRNIVSAARSEPVRNCDRFADELDTQLAFLNEVWLISIDRETMTEQDTYEKWTDEMKTRYGRWLLAHATEKEGGAK